MSMFESNGHVSIIEPVIDFACQLPVQSQPPVPKSIITCPKCGAEQEKSPTCVKCWIIFDKIGIHSRRQSPDNLISFQQRTRFANIAVKGCWNIIRHAKRVLFMILIALQPLIVCFMVERSSGKEIASLHLSESKAVIHDRSGIESWHWNNLSDSGGTVFLSPEMNPICVKLQFSHLQLPSRIPPRHFTYSLRLIDENGVAAFEKSDIQYLTADRAIFANKLIHGDKSIKLLGTLSVNRGGNYKISYNMNDFNDTGIRGFMTTTSLILRGNTVVVPIHIYIISVALGIFLMLMFMSLDDIRTIASASDPRQEPGAVVPHAGICAGGVGQPAFLP